MAPTNPVAPRTPTKATKRTRCVSPDAMYDSANVNVTPQRKRLKNSTMDEKCTTSPTRSAGLNTIESTPVRNTSRTRFSPVKENRKKLLDDKQKLKQKRKTTRRALEPELTECKTDDQLQRIEQIIATCYVEQESDDREMYSLAIQTVREQTKCPLSNVMKELKTNELRRTLTYGEVSVASVNSTILPLLNLNEEDVFYDLGCGTGKIVLQVALQTPCRVSKGIELMQNRVLEGKKALERIMDQNIPEVEKKQVEIVQGDVCCPPPSASMEDATVVFVNNVVFGPELMHKVMEKLSEIPNLRRLVTLRKICDRHRPDLCARAHSFCMEYAHPPEQAQIEVSWANSTSAYLYERTNHGETE